MAEAAEVAGAYLRALAARDYATARGLLDPEVRVRDLSPPGFTELTGVDKVLEYARLFLDQFAEVDLVEEDVYAAGTATYVRVRLRFVHEEKGERVLEQHHFVTVEDGRIVAIDELCSGLYET
jgi:ketosteroid isomerase-like protein